MKQGDRAIMEVETSSVQERRNLVPSYLDRIASAALSLAQNENSMEVMEDSSSLPETKDCQEYLDRIASDLLRACRLDIMTLSTEKNLPEHKPPPVNQDRDVPRDETQVRPWRRTDYLRALLRAMAPIAIDVAAHIGSLLVPNDATIAISQQDAEAFFILASVWLPIAPHITPLVSDIFALENFPSPLEEIKGASSNNPLSSHDNQHRMFLLVEASWAICYFYGQRGEIKLLLKCWNWSPILLLMPGEFSQEMKNDEAMMDADDHGENIQNNIKEQNQFGFQFQDAICWHTPRIVAYLFELLPKARGMYLKKWNVRENRVPWVVHPWVIDEEEMETQQLQLRGQARIWHKEEFSVPSANLIRQIVPLHPWLVHVGEGIAFVKHNPISTGSTQGFADSASGRRKPENLPNYEYVAATKDKRQNLTRTPTTAENLALLGAAMCTEPHPPPLLICGPHGAGKSSLVRELALIFSPSASTYRDQLLEIHVDEETDAKALIGSYTMTDIPGEFTWKPGALTQAVRTGKWVLLEDIDSVPIEIQAALVKLLEDRVLPLGSSGDMERCHPNFRLFGTCTTTASRKGERLGAGAGKKVLNSSLWRKVHVKPLPFSELKDIALSLFPNLPPSICESALALLEALDRSGRESSTETNRMKKVAEASKTHFEMTSDLLISGGRPASVRDFFKLLSRISNGVVFERDTKYATESQRTLCMAESVDVFLAACPDREKRRAFIRNTVAPTWGLSSDLAFSYLENRRPTTQLTDDSLEVGRAKLSLLNINYLSRRQSGADNFTETSSSLRLMESVAVGIRENEPLLLVGETGCGKTSIIQHLAKCSGREMLVQNLSLQTDSTDLLGGFRPLELQHVAQKVYQSFVDVFVATFSRKQNAEFLDFASTALAKKDWKKLSQCFVRSAKLGLGKMKQRIKNASEKEKISFNAPLQTWRVFSDTAERFERQRLACDSGLVFTFTEGALVDAIREGKWVLLDEINLASSEILQRLCGLLDDRAGSLTLTERGDAVAIDRHPEFRLFAAMNPATDAGKRELHANIRSRFTEIFVDELLDPVELRVVSSRYLDSVLPQSDKPPEHSDIVISSVDVYLRCRELAREVLVDGNGHRPRYTLRTLARAMNASKNLVLQQRLPLKRAISEGFELALQGALDTASTKAVQRVLKTALGDIISKSERDHPGRRPGKGDSTNFVLIKPFWINAGPLEPVDWSETSVAGRSKFILTASAAQHLRSLARAISAGPWPILLEGPTSAGKTTLVEYIAARVGHRVVRINNHEHTDVQEYTGSFAPDSNGSLSFQDGILVRALRRGDWVILDELNLAPSEVLEALNRLLDDNRELYLAEINQTITPHPNFRLFATQNPSGAYGGRKPLSRAFRNRFVELHIGDIPSSEMVTILELRCSCPPSHAKALVAIMDALRQRRSKSGVFLGKDGLITPRDLLRWAERNATSKHDLARDGYMLLAERLRTTEEKEIVRETIEKQLKLEVGLDDLYFGPQSAARKALQKGGNEESLYLSQKKIVSSIAPTNSILRLMTLIMRCIEQQEPVLLVGDTGCGKTTVIELLSVLLHSELKVINCHATTETSDLIGGLRPVRGRNQIAEEMLKKVKELLRSWPDQSALALREIPGYIIDPDFSGVPPVLEFANGEDQVTVASNLPEGAVGEMISFVRTLWLSTFAYGGHKAQVQESPRKRQKLTEGDSGKHPQNERFASLSPLINEVEELYRRHSSLFEWADGPVAEAMKSGKMLLLDELSLAEDAVLERINSVLEPSRTLVLAEKGEDVSTDLEQDSRVIKAHQSFRIFATMNPGGDYGKRELSPALRSRFTEIWVPAVEDSSDIELVLGRSLASAHETVCPKSVLPKMLAFVDWFNNSVCNDTATPYAGLSLSLRDVLAWTQFLVKAREVNRSLDLWDAYCHGAALMHLDGLGLGTGLAMEDARSLKARAQAFLLRQTPTPERVTAFSSSSHKLGFAGSGQLFGTHPFWIQVGQQTIRNSSFVFGSPKTAENIYRVLRAMQLPKPILLEGSPGVGKTSLVLALANAAGHRLVRINLSEQTDMSDLMGSDLPVPEKNTDGVMEASFKWCDGVLLTAIKNGHWVLLDELNLASQSVLEGLNSCLDYRASIFVPELGKTFLCPPTFRVFAAQNPMTQGGGRKGLPRSFLNRFTKVHVDSLTGYDLRAIASSKYPALTNEVIDKMVTFNDRVHTAVVDQHKFGQAGTPWEFNLRDVFRWADLLVSEADPSCPSACARVARDIYLQRFRSRKDRDEIRSLYFEVFGVEISTKIHVEFKVTDQIVQVGAAILPRLETSITSSCDLYRREPALFRSLLRPMEAVSHCVQMRWPCLLVGGPASGKTSVLSGLSELCNASLVEVTLSPSSDVNELIGCFEQVDTAAKDREVLYTIKRIASNYVLGHRDKKGFSHRVCELLFQLERELECLSDSQQSLLSRNETLHSLVLALVEGLESAAKSLPEFSLVYSQSISDTWNYVRQECPQGTADTHFQWVDGILARAMIEGSWLLLENVNLCPSSVLDRLNPVMEKDGQLLMAECGVQEDENSGLSHRVVRAHPNFRLFLSMDPENGEVSRAMRNRCVEIAFLQPQVHLNCTKNSEAGLDQASESFVDNIDVCWRAGLRSSKFAEELLQTFRAMYDDALSAGNDTPNIKTVAGSAALGSCLLTHGLAAENVAYFLDSVFSLEMAERMRGSLGKNGAGGIITSPPFRSMWLEAPHQAIVQWESRLIRLFLGWRQGLPAPTTLIPNGYNVFALSCPGSESLAKKYKEICPSLFGRESTSISLRDFLAMQFLATSSTEDVMGRLAFLGGHDDPFVETFKIMTALFHESFPDLPATGKASAFEWLTEKNIWELIILTRLPQKTMEVVWYERMLSKNMSQMSPFELNVLDISFFIHKGCIDRSAIPCQVTPVFYPMIQAVDSWVGDILAYLKPANGTSDFYLLDMCGRFLSRRDQFWLFLYEAPFLANENGFLTFDEAKFIVQWKWFKKSLRKLEEGYMSYEWDLAMKKRSQMNSFIEMIDTAVFGEEGKNYNRKSTWNKIGHPLVPRGASQWEALEQLRDLARSCSLERCDRSERRKDLDLKDLIEMRHPSLFVGQRDKSELLLAISMIHWSSTDEVTGETRPTPLSFSYQESCSVFRDQWNAKQREFESQIKAMKIDETIDTVENLIGLEELNTLAPGVMSTRSLDHSSVTDRVLCEFGKLQLAGCSEKWCGDEELKIRREICKLAVETRHSSQLLEGLRDLLPKVRLFVDEALARTTWPLSDLRPYQTLIWACESSSFPKQHTGNFVRCLLPVIFSASLEHSMARLHCKKRRVSNRMQMPVFSDGDNFTGDQYMDPSSFSRIGHSSQSDAWIQTETLFSLVGGLFAPLQSRRNYSSFVTMENFRARAAQSRDFLRILSAASVGSADRAPFEIKYFLLETLESLTGWFIHKEGNKENIFEMFQHFITTGESEGVRSLAGQCSHTVFLDFYEPVVLPLFDLLNKLWGRETRSAQGRDEALPLAFAYLGLLQFHLLLPDSPVDPARKPLAKLELIGSQLTEMRIQISSYRLQNGFLRGNFSPDSDFIDKLLEDATNLEEKRSFQEMKIVERVAHAPPFVDLFREANDFSRNFCSRKTILYLMSIVRDAPGSPSKAQLARDRVKNWQKTVSAFCERLLTHFGAYEDIITPLVNSLRFLQTGLHDLLDECLPKEVVLVSHLETVAFCLQYPMGDIFTDFSNGLETMTSLRLTTKGGVECHRALGFSILSRIVLQKLICGLDMATLKISGYVFASLISKELENEDKSVVNRADLHEEMFREQFPDHENEFKSLLRPEENEKDPETEVAEERSSSLYTAMSAEETDKLCFLHRLLFSADNNHINDTDRAWAFRHSFRAAQQIFESFDCPPQKHNGITGSAGHVLALSLAGSPKNNFALRDVSSRDSMEARFRFYRDPNPEEVMKAAPAIEHLIARITQLLTAFPGNEILLGLFKVADSVRKLDLHSTPVGKAMSGLEIILRHAQDWEQHASQRVQLGSSLLEISQVVAMWRKLELQSWKDLLVTREERFLRQARKHWTRLYKMLHGENHFETIIDPSKVNHFIPNSPQNAVVDIAVAPRWIWKGLGKYAHIFFPTLTPGSSSGLLELGKAMDTFMLTSPLGEYKERLELMKTFSAQLLREPHITDEQHYSPLPISRLLSSLWRYYMQFLPFLSSKLEALRAPIEKNLHDQMKLAKWDEQSYYALAESSEKNHRNLMRCLRDYDEVLEMSVSAFLDEELCVGIRSESSSQDESCISMPPDKLFFPLVCKGETRLDDEIPSQIPLVDRQWTDTSKIEIMDDSYAGKIGQYASRILSFLKKQHLQASWSNLGKANAHSLCDTIFHRIGSLRAEKSTRQMKERALADLFKALKQNGYASTKWATPKETREMMQLFQLPAPEYPSEGLEAQRMLFADSESYCMKYISELQRFRSEVDFIGSKYMTRRQTVIMVNLCEHGLLMMGQQRCLLSAIFADRASLQMRVRDLAFDGKQLPSHQRIIRDLLLDAWMKYRSAVENIRQLSLLFKFSRPLLSHFEAAEWAQGAVGALEAVLSDLNVPEQSIPGVVGGRQMKNAEEGLDSIRKASDMIRNYCEQNAAQNYLPNDAFEVCLEQLEGAASALSGCLDQLEAPQSNHAGQKDGRTLVDAVSSAVKSTLLAVQGTQHSVGPNLDTYNKTEDDIDEIPGLWDCHFRVSKEWASINLKRLNRDLENVISELRDQRGVLASDNTKHSAYVSLVSDLGILSQLALNTFDRSLAELIKFHRGSAKLHYILIRVFRMLVSKGFCSDDASNEDGGNDGDASGKNFEDNNEGTGMGEGDGKQDVTDQLDNEEQLLGLEDKQNDQDQNNKNSKEQLNEEEAEQGMEMEGQFDGDMYDMPEKNDGDENEEDGDKEEELDREMGLEDDPNEQVVDEKLWDDSDDEMDAEHEDNKFEKNNAMRGKQDEDQVRTKEEDEEKGTDQQDDKAEAKPDSDSKKKGEDTEGGNESEHDINEDLDENYEDSHGIDVREEPLARDQEDAQEEPMELDEDLQLGEDDNGGENNEIEEDADDNQSKNEDEEGENPNMDVLPESEDEGGSDNGNEDMQVASAAIPDDAEKPPDETEENEPEAEPQKATVPCESDKQNEGLGLKALDGRDACQETGVEDEDEDNGDGTDGQAEMETGGDAERKNEPSGQGTGGADDRGGNDGATAGEDEKQNETFNEAPNPFKNPGDATRFWHQKLNMVDNDKAEETVEEGASKEEERASGEFEYVGEHDASTTQVLGEVDAEDQATEIEQKIEGEHDAEKSEAPQNQAEDKPEAKSKKQQRSNPPRVSKQKEDSYNDIDMERDNKDEHSEAMEGKEGLEHDEDVSEAEEAGDEGSEFGNRVASDLSRLNVGEVENRDSQTMNLSFVEDEQVSGISSAEASEARIRWSRIQGETYNLALRLCEKLRLVMEPLLASKLKGDYRTGKRINMKRVIGYIASGYRKDKIWLRRTKPAKRNYRVLLAVDDSESMLKSGTGEMALRAMATLAVGMSQLEIGEMGVASFGDDMKLLHPFHQPFTTESGVGIVKNFKFDQPRTRTALCVESAMSVLDTPGDAASLQLMFLISDGRIERDSRVALKRLIREMMERNILLAMIIVEGGNEDGKSKKKSDSILNMKEVSFEKGKPKVKRFIEDYPFPYYLVIDDIQSLPEVLGDALRQWFEMLAQLQDTR